ncbi:hypothetical protein WR25_16671 [Diploscapter pachys]|uniref:Bacterial surface antigen (D15) domain-containing protein n=1 Tax=Diploscapter pachys TaxID=2018661 RepID=A0A2A2LTP6_9BILA|nr:hypothetical protein WR25_16671 [Diploscapter pachys]
MKEKPDKTFHKASVVIDKAAATPSIVEAVQFHGVHITKNDALVKEVSELYRSRTLDELIHNSNLAAKHMHEVGLLDQAVPLIDTSPDNRDGYIVNFVVKEPKRITAGMKAGISTNGDSDVSFNAGRQSLFGRGEAVNSSYSYTIKGDHCFSLSFIKPFLGWQKSLAFLPWNLSNAEENAFILQYRGQLWNKKLHNEVRLNSIWRTLRPTDDTVFPVREHAGHTLKFSLESAIAFDNRDRPILATKGLFARYGIEVAGPFGDAAFFKHQMDFQASHQLPLGLIMAMSAQLKSVKPLGSRDLHVLDRVYLGGQADLRGFALNSIGHRVENSSLGGGTAAASVFHLYRPLYPKDMLYAHAFAAVGSVARVASRTPLQDLQDTQRVSAGLGLTFVFKNIFRLELNYVFPLKGLPGDSKNTGIHIGAGVNFL